MSLDFSVKLKYESNTIIFSVGNKYFFVTYFVTSLTMPNPQSSDASHIRWMMSISAPSGVSSPKQAVNSFLNFFLSFSARILLYRLMLSISQLQHGNCMTTSQITSRIQYLIQTYNNSCAHFVFEIGEKSIFTADFNTIQWLFVIVAYFFGPPCRLREGPLRWQTPGLFTFCSVCWQQDVTLASLHVGHTTEFVSILAR